MQFLQGEGLWTGPETRVSGPPTKGYSRYVAGASNLPFAMLRGYVGTDLPEVTSTIAPIACPFTGEELMAVPALKPDVAISRKGRERT